MIEQIIKKYAERLQITQEETVNIFANILASANCEEELYNLIGYDDIDDIEYILQNKKVFEDKSTYKNKVKYYNMSNSYLVEKEKVQKQKDDDAITVQDDCKADDERQDEHVNTHFDTQIKQNYVEITMPTAKVKKSKDLVSVSVMKKEHTKYFTYKNFNTVQSAVFNTAYLTNSNFLVSAPTGCGKTDVAFLAILKALDKPGKIVLLAPMKALATEITRKLKKRLKNTRILEYTGDTDPKYDEVIDSKIFVATPEKFDAATRGSRITASTRRLLVTLD